MSLCTPLSRSTHRAAQTSLLVSTQRASHAPRASAALPSPATPAARRAAGSVNMAARRATAPQSSPVSPPPCATLRQARRRAEAVTKNLKGAVGARQLHRGQLAWGGAGRSRPSTRASRAAGGVGPHPKVSSCTSLHTAAAGGTKVAGKREISERRFSSRAWQPRRHPLRETWPRHAR